MAAHLEMDSKYGMQTGHQIPVLGFGVYQTPADQAEACVQHAFRQGYRHIDSARVYRNEQPCADAIRASGLPREQVFFTSKVPPRDMGYDRTKKAIAASFAQTDLSYIDLYLIHAPYGGTTARLGTWRALVEAQKAGKIRSIGVSNYGVHHLDELEQHIQSSDDPDVQASRIDVGQWELHPWLPRSDIVSWCQKRDVIIEAYSPLVRGQRASDGVLTKLAEKKGKTWAQVLIRWSLQKGFVPLPKSVTPERIESNAGVFGWQLSESEMEDLQGRNESKERYETCTWDPTVASLAD